MKLGKLLTILSPLAATPAIVLPLSSCSVSKDHSEEIIVFSDGNPETSIQITKSSQDEIRIFFKVKQQGATEQKFSLNWYLRKGLQDQLTVDLEESVQGNCILVKPNKTVKGEGSGTFEVRGTFTNKYGQKAESVAVCYYSINITE